MRKPKKLILAQALAARGAPPESQGAGPAQPLTSVRSSPPGQIAPAHFQENLQGHDWDDAAGNAQMPEPDDGTGRWARPATVARPLPGLATAAAEDALYRLASGADLQMRGYIDKAVLQGDGGAALTLIGNPENARLIREWEKKYGRSWPRDRVTGRRYDVSHKKAIADGGTNTLDNIEPVHPEAHRAQHKASGDHARFARRRWIAQAFGGRVERSPGALGFIPNITGLLSGRIRTDSFENFLSDMVGLPSSEDVRRQNEELRRRYFPGTEPGDWVA